MPRKSDEHARHNPGDAAEHAPVRGDAAAPGADEAPAQPDEPPIGHFEVDPSAPPTVRARARMLNDLRPLRRQCESPQAAQVVPGVLVDRIAHAMPRVAQQGQLEALLGRNEKATISALQWVLAQGEPAEGSDAEMVLRDALDAGKDPGSTGHRPGWGKPALTVTGLAAAQMLSALALVEAAIPGTLAALTTATPRPPRVVALRTPGTPCQYPADAAPLDFSASPWIGRTEIVPESLGSVIVVGASGSGKTTSYVFPPLSAALNYRAGDAQDLPVGGLVIDPKAELVPLVQRWARERDQLGRLVEIGQAAPLRIFTDDDGYTVRERYEIVQRMCAAEAHADPWQSNWNQRAHEVSRQLLEVDEAFHQRTGLPLLELVSSALAGCDQRAVGQWAALATLYRRWSASVHIELRRAAELITALLVAVGLDTGLNPLLRFLALSQDELGNQFYYLVNTARLVTDSAGNPELSRFIDLDVRYGRSAPGSLEMLQLVEAGQIVLYQPEAGALHDLIGRALKARFFDAARRRQSVRRPLVYACDEFQRFYTADPESGEHAFLDCARAYRTTCLLATQSIPALLAAIGRDQSRSDKLAALLANCRTQIFLRTVDATTRVTLESLIPAPPDPSRPHVVKVRPLSGLAVGEAYAIHDGQWGIHRYQLPRAA